MGINMAQYITPVRATLVTRDGFSKHLEIHEMKNVIEIARRPRRVLASWVEPTEAPAEVTFEKMIFELKRHKFVKQSDGGKTVCFAVYEEI